MVFSRRRVAAVAGIALLVLAIGELKATSKLTIPLRESVTRKSQPPHVIYILADDLGWNDVGYHGSEIDTPTLDALAGGGVRLERFYVQPVCTPSRACLLSGRHVTHTGLQHLYIRPTQPNALTLNATLLPELLRQSGYRNYMVGKWHLGFFAKDYLPENRGFDEHFGILTGEAGHYSRINSKRYSLVENGEVYWETETYSTHLYVQKATEYVEQHLKQHPDKPMFLYVSWQAPHTPNQVPAIYSDRYSGLGSSRQIHAGMVTAMDEGVANITAVFKKHGLWDDTVLFFSTDNGGRLISGASNEPLRGEKKWLYEGGIRGVAFAHGRGIPGGRVSDALMHITDIYPTIAHLAQPSRAPDPKLRLDGFNMWGVLSRGEESPRSEVLVNIDPLHGSYGESQFPEIYDTRIRSAIIRGHWKLITGNPTQASSLKQTRASDPNVQLYDLKADPSEQHNLASSRQDLVKSLLARLESYNRTAVTPYYPPSSHGWPDDVFLPYDTDPTHLF